jgi:hypothetical protein
MNIRITLTLITLALTLASSQATAEIYFGAGFGNASYEGSFEDSNSLELILGNKISDTISIEGSFLKFDDTRDNIPPVWTVSVDGFTLGAVGSHSISPDIELQAKIGLYFWDLEVKQDGAGTVFTDDGSDTFFGFGAMYHLNSSTKLGLRYTSYEASDGDIDVLSGQLQLAF